MSSVKKPFKIFLVEDDIWYAEILQYHLSLNPDYLVERYETGKDCMLNLKSRPDLITVDYSLPDMEGLELIDKIKAFDPTIPIIVVSGQEDVKIALELLKKDSVEDYVVKDDEAKDRLWKSVARIKEKLSLKEEVASLKEELVGKYAFQNIIKGESDGIKRVFKLMQKACDNNITVSITGETGTGKELVAKCIHYNSLQKAKSFVAVNVTAIPSELIESELFGHEKGAFTGAQTRRIGKFEEANNGTIFLDEIADMDLSLQAKLLRVLQEQEVTRVGSNKPVKINTRIIVATHKNLADQVKQGKFREDLYYRLLGLPIELPPLRDRKSDVLILAKYFADEFCKKNKKQKKKFSEAAQKKMLTHTFKGNIRELKAVIDLACVMADEKIIEVEDITFNSTESIADMMSSEKTLKEYNTDIINHFLKKYNDNVATVAKKLDVGKSTLYRMLKNEEL